MPAFFTILNGGLKMLNYLKELSKIICMNEKIYISFNIEKPAYQLESGIFLNSLFNFTSLLEEIHKEIVKKGKLQIGILPVSRGSFNIDLSLGLSAIESIKSVLTYNGISYLSDLVATLVNLILLKKFLKGEKPDKVKKDENSDMVTLYRNGYSKSFPERIYKIYSSNEKINRKLTKTFEPLLDDLTIGSVNLKIYNDYHFMKDLNISRRELVFLTTENQLLRDKYQIIVLEYQPIKILKIVFDFRRKWEFFYEGDNISALILDGNFISAVNSGHQFSKGDLLIADLERIRVYDEESEDYVNLNKDFKILKVHKHITKSGIEYSFD